jgi:Flp pilus assembly protein TadG
MKNTSRRSVDRSESSSSTTNKQRGAAFVELAVALPLLLTALMGVFDLGRWMSVHYTASRIAFEASRYAIALPGLERDDFDISIDKAGTFGATVPADPLASVDALSSSQSTLARRMALIVERQRTVSYDANSIRVFGGRKTSATANEDDVVEIQVEIPFEPMFPLVSKVVNRVRASVRASYLLN